jgi:hypothetical protein
MAVAQGYGKTVTSGSVFAYDVADTRNSYIGEPTTNVFVHYGTTGEGSGADNGVTFNVNGTGTFIRLGYGQTFGGYTIKPEDVVYKYDLGAYGCHYHGSDTTIPNGKYATFSFDYYISPGTADLGVGDSLLANFENALGGGINLPNTNTGIWQSVSFTSGPTSGGTLRSLLYPGACGPRLASSGYILYKNPQVEYLPHKTPFVQTTRSVTQGLLPLVGNSTIDLTNVSFDSNAQMTFDGTDDLVDITTNFGTLSAYTFEYVAYANSGGNMPIASRTNTNFYKYGAYSWRYTHGGVGGEFYHNYGNDTGWAHWVITYDGSTISVWENGVSKGTSSSSGTADFSGGIRIGSWASSAAYTWDGTIPVMKMYNRGLSAGEVRQNYLHYKTRFNLS